MVKLMWTEQGMLLGDVIESSDERVKLENPVFVVLGAQGAQLVPILGLTEQKTINVNKRELLFDGEMVDPVTELRNHYSKAFGSGVQLVTR